MASTDTFSKVQPSISAPYRNAIAVTPSDSDDLGAVTRAVHVGTSGTLAVIMAGAASSTETVSFTVTPAMSPLHIRVKRILVAGTAGTSQAIVALW